MTLEAIDASALPALHRLNEAHAVELSSVTPETFAAMIRRAFLARRVDEDAFLIAFDQSAEYDSPNFLWFQAKYPRFVYVDRIVVSPTRRGEGIARRFYEALIGAAREAGHDRIVAEVNSDPPNPGSDAFHAALGFEGVGEAVLADRGKSVRYLCRLL